MDGTGVAATAMEAMFARMTANIGAMIEKVVEKKMSERRQGCRQALTVYFFVPFIAINQQSKLIYFLLLLFVITDRAAYADYANNDSPARESSDSRKNRGSLICNDVFFFVPFIAINQQSKLINFVVVCAHRSRSECRLRRR